MNHRREIDGLRALAVLPVILFHAGFGLFSGGFIGVDIFFVISGYLITGIILDDLSRGTFSIRRFYARRARRILPALFCVMLASIPFAFAWMVPSQYEDFSHSLVAVVLFISNIFFWRESGYFAAEASEKPLLHTWSLGVEEQFYLLFPLALLLLWRFGKRPSFYGLAIMAIVSLGLCDYASRYAFNANFFLIPTRAWELFAGALCAFLAMERAPTKNNLLSLLGLFLVLFALLAYDEQMRLPSLSMLVPVLGTTLILRYGTSGSWVARLLSWRGFVGIGLISYSAYLWHHPLFAFARIRIPTTPEPSTMLLLTLAALVLGALSWRFIEQPFRQKQHRWYVPNRRALPLAIIAAAIVCAIGIQGHLSHGRLSYWTAHASPHQARAFALMEEAKKPMGFYDNGDCIFHVNHLNTEIEDKLAACRKKYGPGIAIIGDSHAINLFYVLKNHFGKRPFIAGISQGMCRPHSNLPMCYYDRLLEILQKNPDLFHDVIYEQAGFHLLANAQGKEIDQGDLSGLPLDATVPDYTPNKAYIDAVIAYLNKIARFSRVTWLTPRLEPEIRETTIIHLGCDYVFPMRPHQAELFKQLDDAIRLQLKNTEIHHRSQVDLVKLDMAQDFMTCEKTYWKDRNHYSREGEKRFGERITLDALIGGTPR